MARRIKKVINRDCWNSIGIWAKNRACDLLDEYIHCRNCPVFKDAGRGVLESSPPPGYMAQWKNELATEQKEVQHGDIGIVVFRVGNEWYALPARIVEEIACQRPIHRIPRNENPYLLGVVNIGGEINISYSIVNILNVNNVDNSGDMKIQNDDIRLVVVKVNSQNYVFPVDEVRGLTRYFKKMLITPPATIGNNEPMLLHGVIEYEGLQIAIIDENELSRCIEKMTA